MCDEKTLRDIFKVFDKDGSGKIDMNELVEVMKAYFDAVGEPADARKCRDTAAVIMKEIDTGGDGTINIDEFITAFK
jgi:Ca2+-binding EF-hand superfamily protein